MFLFSAIYNSLYSYQSSFSCQHRSEWVSLFNKNSYCLWAKNNYLKCDILNC